MWATYRSDVIGMLKTSSEPYEMIATMSLWSIHIAIFAKAAIVPDVTGIQVRLRTWSSETVVPFMPLPRASSMS